MTIDPRTSNPSKSSPKELGTLLSNHMKRKAISTSKLAHMLDIPRATLCLWKVGAKPPASAINKIAEILELSAEEHKQLLELGGYPTNTANSYITTESSIDTSIHPPRFAECLLQYILNKNIRDGVIGDLEENFRAIYHDQGQQKATK